MGLDSINTIWSWKRPLELFKLCKFIIATRPGSKIRTFRRLIKFPPLGMNKDRISLIELKIKISSSDLRDRIKKGKNTSKFLPPPVAAYIGSESLYKQ
jgi:nicotinate-nucleotide adenylyltransferase